MQIPIENIYYLLSYAWNKLEEKDKVKVDIEDKTNIIDLLAKVLITSTKILLKRGIDRSYVDFTEEINAIKGKIEISSTLKSNLHIQQKAICTFDEFSPNILSNRILLTTMHRLARTKQIDKSLKAELVSLIKMFAGIELIEINKSLFSKIKITRNNHFYGFIMNVCQLINDSLMPSEKAGKYSFYDFTKDDRKMNQLFEAFVRNFYVREQTKYLVKRENIYWSFDVQNQDDTMYLPKMETDISLFSQYKKIIIDAKFYRETMSSYYGSEKIKSGNLYQLFSYLLNQQDQSEISMNATGILLYPTVVDDYSLRYAYKTHEIKICTVNLNTGWQSIHNRLLEILE